MYYVYILVNRRRTVFYTGSTSNLKNRVYCHKKGLIKGFTKKYNLDELVYFESLANVQLARRREKQIKSYSRVKKQTLVKSKNPSGKDLSNTLK